MENPASESTGAHKKLRWTIFAVIAGFLALAAVLVFKWPYTKSAMIRRLERASSAKVEIEKFRSTYFPYPGCIAENVVFRKPALKAGNAPHGSQAEPSEPLLTIKTLTVQSTYTGLFSKPKRIREIVAEGVRMHQLRGEGGVILQGNLGPSAGSDRDQLVIEELRVNQAVLEIASRNAEKPLTFQIHRALFRNLSTQTTIPFEVAVLIPALPGEVRVAGWIGPARGPEGNFCSTPISGFYSLQQADLGVFRALGGQISSRGEFAGNLERLNVSGSTESPNFEVTASRHRFPLSTKFRGVLDLRNGDLALPSIHAKLGNTSLEASARIAGRPKTVDLNVMRGKGEIQDLILLFSKAPRSPMTGPVIFHAEAVLPPEHRPFKQRVQLTGDFNVDPAHFSSPNTQEHVDQLSERARGEKDKAKGQYPDGDASGFERVITGLRGHVVLKNGMAVFSNLLFRVPGAEADMNGTYNLVNKRVKLRGKMRMQATVSQATTGFKSLLLKILDPMFKKKGGGAEVPVAMTGTYGHTRFKAGLK